MSVLYQIYALIIAPPQIWGSSLQKTMTMENKPHTIFSIFCIVFVEAAKNPILYFSGTTNNELFTK